MAAEQKTTETRSEDPWDAEPDLRPWWRRNLPLVVTGGTLAAVFLAAVVFRWG